MGDIDLFENFILSTFYLRSGLQICTGTKEFELSMPSAVQEIYGGMDAGCKYVGPMLLSEEQGRVSSIPHGSKCERQWIDEPFPHDELEKYKRNGKKIVYASFGTVATGFFWDYSGPTSNMMGAKTSGKEFCRTMWERIFQALEETTSTWWSWRPSARIQTLSRDLKFLQTSSCEGSALS